MFCISCLLFSSWKWLRITIHLLRRRCLPVLPLFCMQICHLLFSTSLFIMLTLFPHQFNHYLWCLNLSWIVWIFLASLVTRNVQKCGKLLNLRTSWESDMVLLWRVLGRILLKKPFTIIPQDLKGSLEKLVCLVPINMEKSVYCSSLTVVPVTSHLWEGRKPPDIRLDITAHVMQCTKEANPFLAWKLLINWNRLVWCLGSCACCKMLFVSLILRNNWNVMGLMMSLHLAIWQWLFNVKEPLKMALQN